MRKLYHIVSLVMVWFLQGLECLQIDGSLSDGANYSASWTKMESSNEILNDFHRICGNICACSFNEQRNLSVVCNDRGLETIPDHLPLGTTILIYTRNKIKNHTVTDEFLLPAKKKHVIHLDLSFNGIEMITTDAFYEFDSLRVLNLNGNGLKRIRTSFLIPVQSTLLRLYADYVDPQFMWNMFMTSQYKQENCDDVTSLPKLKYLHLNDNQLESLNPLVITCLTCGKKDFTVFLQNNSFNDKNIHKLLAGTRNKTQFCGGLANPMKSVLTLDFRENQITGFNKMTLEKFSRQIYNRDEFYFRLFAGRNPIECECEVGGLEKYLHTAKSWRVIMDRDDITCATPKVLQGVKISELDSLHINYCSGEWADKFALRTSQLIFIIICATTLLFVSISVAYLNRSKCLVHCDVICNGEEDNLWVSKHRDKYSIPQSYTGVNSNYSIEASTTAM